MDAQRAGADRRGLEATGGGPARLRPGRSARGLVMLLTFVAAVLAAPSAAQAAENLIKQPGAHNRYSFELEPHLYFRYARGADGFGPGVRAAIPFMHNGPIETINNNIGISFGLDLPYYGIANAFLIDLPVAFQWNFYFTDVISVIGEAGLVTSIFTPSGYVDVDPLFQGGGRFQFGKVGLLVRVGYPGLSVGANFQF